ncbi:MAG: tRNA (adenosine(37)-N6)-dimethylallyltransferase MiaA [Anaerolineales bacterium]|nr:tRNA (adenosine(37)-N6)-dimethylallyltransferase MiaA [Anaerolineales bacterium]
MSSDKHPLIVIIGPTAVGKTELSLQLAERMEGEIVSSDSRLFYRGMDIGTAKPSPTDRARAPHHLIDVADPDETWSLAIFQAAARQAITTIRERGNLPFLVGGTGQYLRAVTEGWLPPQVKPDPRLRAVLESLADQHDINWLHAGLRRLDPQASARIDPRNVRRTIRALEVILTTGRPFSAMRTRGASPYRLLTIGLNRPRVELYKRVDERIETMFAAGLLEEVRRLLDQGYTPDLPSMSAIGYRECIAVLNEKISLEEAKQKISRATRVFVRRQANWFKESDPAIHWFDAGQAKLVSRIETLVKHFLSTA